MKKPTIIPIRKKASVLRDERNSRIKSMYNDLMSVPGSQRTAVCEHIAEQLKGQYAHMSYSTVIKITK